MSHVFKRGRINDLKCDDFVLDLNLQIYSQFFPRWTKGQENNWQGFLGQGRVYVVVME